MAPMWKVKPLMKRRKIHLPRVKGRRRSFSSRNQLRAAASRARSRRLSWLLWLKMRKSIIQKNRYRSMSYS
jgi:hypothetical protein